MCIRDRHRTANMLAETQDHIRRLEAVLSDYDAEPFFEKTIEEDDSLKFQEMLTLYKAMVIEHCDYVSCLLYTSRCV